MESSFRNPAGIPTSQEEKIPRNDVARRGPAALRFFLTLAALLLGCCSGAFLHRELGGNMATLELEARISGGDRLRIYQNAQWSEPQDVKISPGQWTVYRFVVPSRLTVLRIDPSDVDGAEMLIRGIRLRASNGAVQSVALLPPTPGQTGPIPVRVDVVRVLAP